MELYYYTNLDGLTQGMDAVTILSIHDIGEHCGMIRTFRIKTESWECFDLAHILYYVKQKYGWLNSIIHNHIVAGFVYFPLYQHKTNISYKL